MTIAKLREHYVKQSEHDCISIPRFNEVSQIILIRHGEPDLEKGGLFNRKESLKYKEDYKISAIRNFDKSPLCLDSLPKMKVFHSSLRRAEHTAELIFNQAKFQLTPSDDFVEFDRQAVEFINLKLPIRWWNFLSRFLWFLGVNQKNYERFPEARRRVKRGADKLIQYSNGKNLSILVAHGIYNKFIGFELYSRGWRKVLDEGRGYLAVKVYARGNSQQKNRPVLRSVF